MAHEVTALLAAWSDGDESAYDRLVPLVYEELHRLAHRYMRRERDDHTLQTTALVGEAYLRLVGQRVEWQSREHFFATSARLMRRILVDHARARGYRKRGGGARRVPLEDVLEMSDERAAELVALDEALDALARMDERKARVVELRFFGGLEVEETARLLGVSPNTVKRDWRAARAWLYKAVTK
ncbi:MAG: sigma-70 family RNA polymerase sigma factor [Acidobacteria bacterium]|nr:sigma-70 family RNA polymerase sigma factor [Acidobacteriota bacterium]